ncbi:hypothetical protein, partial [Bilophila wadsworthia]|uniref:hypothetical protein n=1 Tax=Bilophila wadsworthia TaxID=35833 RepID=UPI0032619CE5
GPFWRKVPLPPSKPPLFPSKDFHLYRIPHPKFPHGQKMMGNLDFLLEKERRRIFSFAFSRYKKKNTASPLCSQGKTPKGIR